MPFKRSLLAPKAISIDAFDGLIAFEILLGRDWSTVLSAAGTWALWGVAGGGGGFAWGFGAGCVLVFFEAGQAGMTAQWHITCHCFTRSYGGSGSKFCN